MKEKTEIEHSGELATDQGVDINGVVWATRNVNMPGTFTEASEDAGMVYQWNRKTGWSSVDPLESSDGSTEWDATYANGKSWAAKNDPSPEGWRVPTKDDFRKLCDTGHVDRKWQNSPSGYVFTDRKSGNSIFLPACGERYPKLSGVGSHGYYWSADPHGPKYNGYHLYFNEEDFSSESYLRRCDGLSVRPVKKV